MRVQRQNSSSNARAGPRRCGGGSLRTVIFSLLPVLAACAAGAQALSEYQVKAAFLLNFTKFIEWPAESFASTDSPLNICILGDDPFGKTLDQLVEGETVNGRKLTVQRLRGVPPPKSCQVLFISKSEEAVSSILPDLGPGVLTVSDRDGFLREGGMICLVIEGRHVRFDINQRAAARASLTLSARMLNVARIVKK